jgi:hypothetical protein
MLSFYNLLIAVCNYSCILPEKEGGRGMQKTTALEAKLNICTLAHKTAVSAGQSVKCVSVEGCAFTILY